MGRETYFSRQQFLCHNAKVVHVFEAEVLRKSPGSEIEITFDTQLSIAHAAPPYVSLPAVSSIGGLRTPARCARTTFMGPASENLHRSRH